MARFVGVKIHGDRLRRLRGPQHRFNAGLAVEKGLEIIAKIAKDSIIEGSVSGPGHQPSAPGTPPNADTHELDQSIKVQVNRSTLYGKVIADAEYAAAQEFGTSTLPERPYLRPAGRQGRPQARILLAEAIRRTNRGR